MKLAEAYGNAVTVVAFGLVVAFVVLFHRWSPWRSSDTGRHIMTKELIIGAILGLGVVRITFGATLDVPWFAWLRATVFTGIPVIYGWQIGLLAVKQGRILRRARGDAEHSRGSR